MLQHACTEGLRLNRHLVDEVRELDAAVAQARAKASKSAQKSVDAQEEMMANKSMARTNCDNNF